MAILLHRTAFTALVCCMLAGCAAPSAVMPQGSTAEIEQEAKIQKNMVVQRVIDEDTRLQNVAFPIWVANADLCPQKTYTAGIEMWNIHAIPKEYKDSFQDLYSLDDALRISRVTMNSPAAKAGLKAGDVIVAIQDKPVGTGKKALSDAVKAFDDIEGAAVDITYERDGERSTRTIARIEACDDAIVYDPHDTNINAFADGEAIYMTRGMMRFTDNDTELALVLSHELAHNAMLHSDKKGQNAIGVGLAGLALEVLIVAAGGIPDGSLTRTAAGIGGQINSVEFEQEADYVGMYFMARAGHDTQGVASFWRRMASENSANSIVQRDTHPTAPERFVAIEKTHEEIEARKAKGEQLVPILKKENGTLKGAKTITLNN